MTKATQAMLSAGQSPWLDYISRELLRSGELARMVADDEVTGLTSNPSIFDKALSGSNLYEAEIAEAAADGVRDPYEAFLRVAIQDIRGAADALLPIYERSAGRDGFVSLEIPPGIEGDYDRTVAEAKRLAMLVRRPNLMVKVPGTPEGVRAVEELIFAGINVNQTLLFSCDVYEQTARSYIRGLERRQAAALPLDRPASVASFFVSRVDTAIDAELPADSPLRGKAAVANARDAYGRFAAIFSGHAWDALAAAGARPQRPLWASTSTKNPDYRDVLYVEELVAPDTVNTLPEPTLRAVLDHGEIRNAIDQASIDGARTLLGELNSAGIDMAAVTSRLLVEGLDAFDRDFQRLLDRIGQAIGSPVASA